MKEEKSGSAIMHQWREDRWLQSPDRHAVMLTQAVLHAIYREEGNRLKPETEDLVADIIASGLSGIASVTAQLTQQVCDLTALHPGPITWSKP